ncbi:MAG: hemolysin family protein [Luteitalea sp.]
MIGTLLVLTLLVLVTSLYVAAEFATVSVRRSRIRQMAEDGHGTARRLLPILESPAELDRYIAACQVGITLSSLILGAYGQIALGPGLSALLRDRAGLDAVAAVSTSTLLILLVLTIGHMVAGELAPKSLALEYPTRVALYTYWPMRWSLWVLMPFIWFLNGSGILLLRLLGSEPGGHGHIHSPDEIELLITDSRDGGLLEPDEHQRLQRALRFSLRTAGQMMVPRDRVQAIDVATPVDDLLTLALDSPHAHLPVFSGTLDTIVGILNTKQLLVRQLGERPVRSVREVLQTALTVSHTLTGDRLVELLRQHRSHQALVLDDADRVAGIVTLDNILSSLLGPTPDEFTQSSVRTDAPGATRWRT